MGIFVQHVEAKYQKMIDSARIVGNRLFVKILLLIMEICSARDVVKFMKSTKNFVLNVVSC